MKLTSYYPVFYTDDLDAESKRYVEDLGFSILHRIRVKDLEYFILENNGNRIDLIQFEHPFSPSATGFYGIRANVDNFDEGFEYFKNQGMVQEGAIREDDSAKTVVLIGRDGMRIVLFHHKK